MDRFDEGLARIEHRLQPSDARAGARHPDPHRGRRARGGRFPPAARHADIWHSFEPIEEFRRKNELLKRLATDAGRDEADIERAMAWTDAATADAFVDEGVTLFTTEIHPDTNGYDFSELEDHARLARSAPLVQPSTGGHLTASPSREAMLRDEGGADEHAAPGLRTRRDDGSITGVATKKPQTISYPAPDSRPRRHDYDPLDPHVIVLFGATGDLAKRKLISGLAYLDQSELAPDIQIVATSLEELSDDEFREIAKNAIDSYGTHKLTPDQWADFAKIVHYVPQGAGPEALANAVAEAENNLGPERQETALPLGPAQSRARRHHHAA